MAKRKLTSGERFKMWYEDIFTHLEKTDQIDGGNGAIIALIAAMPLYERWVDKEGRKYNPIKSRGAVLKDDLGFKTDEEGGKFWNVFRDGLSHSASFFVQSDKAQSKQWTLPKIGLNAAYPNKPTFAVSAAGEDVIIVNPWGLIRHILSKHTADPSLIERADAPLLEVEVEE